MIHVVGINPVNGMELEVVSKIKHLGVLLDNSLDWKNQVQAVFKGFQRAWDPKAC